MYSEIGYSIPGTLASDRIVDDLHELAEHRREIDDELRHNVFAATFFSLGMRVFVIDALIGGLAVVYVLELLKS